MAEKSIRQQVQDSIKSVAEKNENEHASADPNSENKAFIASATAPDFGEDHGAPDANDAPPEAAESAPLDQTVPNTGEAAGKAPSVSSSQQTQSAPSGSNEPNQSDEDEWEDTDYEDSSVGHKFTFKARKSEREQLLNRMMMRSDYDRKLGRLGRFQSEFQEAIESGYMDKVAPVYKAIDSDPVLAQAVSQLYQQRMQNQPLSYYQPGHEPQPVVQQQPQYQQQEQVFSDDPYLQAATKPIMDQLSTVQQQMQQWQQAQQQQASQAATEQQRRNAELAEWSQIHQTLVREFPQEYTGNIQSDLPKMQQLNNYAAQAGYTREFYGPWGRILQAKRAIDASTPRGLNQAPATQSAAAQSVAAAQQQAEAAARKARQDVANGTVVNSSQAPEPKPQRPPRTKDKNGKPLPVKEAVKNIAARFANEASR